MRSVYHELRKHLDKHPTGAPESSEIIEILSELFTPEEAEIALGAPFRPRPVEVIASRAGVPAERALKVLEGLADRGLVYAREKDGEWGYALLPIMPGLFEFPYMKGVKDDKLERLAVLWQSYLEKVIKEMDAAEVPFARVVPIQEEIEGKAEVLPYERVYEMIDEAGMVGIAHCACRVAQGNCDAPLEACMVFDDTCTFLVERGFARYITKEEMKEKLRQFDGAGLVHTVNNSRDKLQFVCNCCRCCCGFLLAVRKYDQPSLLATSNFVASVDTAECTGCGVCEDRCPMGAISMDGEIAVVDPKRCIGCALCVTGCEFEAVGLERRTDLPETPGSMPELGIELLRSRGKLDEFIELNR